MDTIIVAREEDMKRWFREILREELSLTTGRQEQPNAVEPLLSREQIATYLDNISLVTLHAWMKTGLPYHKQGRRVYFLRSEVLEYVRKRASGKSVGISK